MKRPLIIALACAMALSAAPRKRTTTASRGKLQPVAETEAPTSPAIACDTVAGPGALNLAGYEKPQRATQESVIIASGADAADTVVAVELTLVYVDMRGRMLHKRTLWVDIPGALPPGEARTVNFPSWDKQQTRYYCRGPEPRNPRAIPFDIRASILRRAIPAAILRPALSSPASDPK